MESSVVLGEKDYLACCGSVKFAEEMVLAGPFSDYQQTVNAARDIWFNKVCPSPSLSLYLHWWLCIYVWVFLLGEWICFQVDVNGWLEAFAAHPQIGESPSRTHKSPTSAQFSFLPLSNIFFSLVVNFLGGLGCGWETLWARLISRFWFQHFWLNDPDKAPEFLTELDIHLVFVFLNSITWFLLDQWQWAQKWFELMRWLEDFYALLLWIISRKIWTFDFLHLIVEFISRKIRISDNSKLTEIS